MGARQTGTTLGGLVAALLLPPIAVSVGWSEGLQIAAGFTLLTVLCFAFFYREPPIETAESASGAAESPSVPISATFKSPSFLAVTGYGFVFMGAQGSATSYLALSLNEEVGLSVVAAGALLAVFQVGGIAGRIGWGVFSDRTGRRTPVMLLVGLIAIGSCIVMAFVGQETFLPLIIVLAFILGCSAMGWNGLYMTLVAELVPLRAAATALGASLTVAFVGMLLTPAFGLVADLTGSYGASWLLLAGWIAVGTALGLLIKDP